MTIESYKPIESYKLLNNHFRDITKKIDLHRKIGAPGAIRTPGLLIRSQMLLNHIYYALSSDCSPKIVPYRHVDESCKPMNDNVAYLSNGTLIRQRLFQMLGIVRHMRIDLGKQWKPMGIIGNQIAMDCNEVSKCGNTTCLCHKSNICIVIYYRRAHDIINTTAPGNRGETKEAVQGNGTNHNVLCWSGIGEIS